MTIWWVPSFWHTVTPLWKILATPLFIAYCIPRLGELSFKRVGSVRRKVWKESLRGPKILFCGPGLKCSSTLKGTNSKTYLLLTEFEWPYCKLWTEFFLLRFMAQARSVRAINRRGKNEDPKLTVRTEKTRLVRYLLYLYRVSDGSGTISIHTERLQISDAPRKQNESISNRFLSR